MTRDNPNLDENEEDLLNALLEHIPKEDMRDVMNMVNKNEREKFMEKMMSLALTRPLLQMEMLRYYKRKHGDNWRQRLKG